MKAHLYLLAGAMICMTVVCHTYAEPQHARIASSDGTIQLNVTVDNEVFYSVELDGKPLVAASRLGLGFEDGLTLGSNVEVVKVDTGEHNDTWTDDFGKFRMVNDHYKELRLHLREVRPSSAPSVEFGVIIRAYNDGVALRKFKLTKDLTEFLFEKDFRGWIGAHTGYENQFPEIRLSRLSDQAKSLPLVMDADGTYVAVAEADVREWAGMSLVGAQARGAYGVRSSLISRVESETPHKSPWHALIIARNAGELVVSTMLRNLATPSQIADTSWIKPGISACDTWWTGENPYWDRYKGLDSRGNTQSHKDYIDLASGMGWRYMLIDWYWYDQDSEDRETAIKPLDHVDMPELMAYAKKKGVEPLLWVNSKNIGSIGMDKLFATYAKWGAGGVKLDFFHNNGSQGTLRWQEELIACVAKHKLLINLHGTYTPTGLSRTWPNFVSQEGILGEEYTKLGTSFTPEHMMALPFTRGLLGPSDVTPGGFVNVREDEFVPNAIPAQVVGTRARQLALTVLMDSPLIVLCDSPKNYLGEPGLAFYRGCRPPGMKRRCWLPGSWTIWCRRGERTMVCGWPL